MGMQLFSDLTSNISKKFSGKKIAVGVDVSTKSVKVVLLEKENKQIVLKNYAIARTKESLIQVGEIGVINDFAGNIVKETLSSAGIKNDLVNVAIPSFTSLIITIEVPYIASKKFDEAIRREVSKYIPVKIEDVVYDWQIIDEDGLRTETQGVQTEGSEKKPQQDGTMVKILVIAVMQEISSRYNEVFSLNNLDINLLEIDSISLARSLTRDKKGVYLILDIGHAACNILLSSHQGILLNRTIDVGGDKMTKIIADSMKTSFDRAEQLKREQGINVMANDQRTGVLSTALSMITSEIKKTIQLFNADFKGVNINGIILTGGSASMIGLKDLIQKEVGVETKIGNALEGIAFKPEIKDALLSHASALSIAIGLALINFEK